MSDGSYSFNPNGALDTGAELALVTRKIAESLDALEAAASAFLTANAGASIESYQTAQQTWSRGQKAMEDSLVKGVAALESVHDQYTLADNTSAAVFGGSV